MKSPLDQKDPQELGERLRAARSMRGLTQEDAAQRLDLARTTLVAIEKGQRRVRSEELRKLADLYDISLNSLLRDTALHVDLVPRFRALLTTDVVVAQEAAQMLSSLAAAEVELEQRLGHSLKTNYPPEFRIQSGDLRGQAEDLAMEMRLRYGLGLSPIRDMLSFLELEIGFRVFIRVLPKSSISGLFVYDDRLGACMLLNQSHSRKRRIVSASHEFAHFLTTRKAPDVADLEVDPNSKEEKFARYFSAAFPMPATVVRRKFFELKEEAGRFSPRHLILLAHYFNVSEEAFCRRLEDLELIPAGMWDSLRDRGFSTATIRQVIGDEVLESEPVMPPRLWMLAVEAYRREYFDEGQLAKMLCMDRVEIRRMLDTMDIEGTDDLQSLPS